MPSMKVTEFLPMRHSEAEGGKNPPHTHTFTVYLKVNLVIGFHPVLPVQNKSNTMHWLSKFHSLWTRRKRRGRKAKNEPKRRKRSLTPSCQSPFIPTLIIERMIKINEEIFQNESSDCTSPTCLREKESEEEIDTLNQAGMSLSVTADWGD